MTVRIGNAPCSWGVLEFDRVSSLTPYDRMLDELVAAGYEGTELGEWGYLPADASRLSQELTVRRLSLVAGFMPVALVDPSEHARGMEASLRTARLLAAVGGLDALLVLSDDNARVPVRAQLAGRITPEHGLSSHEWSVFAAAADRIARQVHGETGLRTVFHPHCGGYVETMDEIDQLMARTAPELLGLCLDTGHIAFGGGDPLEALERYASRVWHVHFKDCDRRVAATARREGLDYGESVRRQLFCELGAGDVDFPNVVQALQRQRYSGWIVVEQDVFPSYGTPEESARHSREYLRALGL